MVVVDGIESVVGTPEVEEWEIAVLHRDHTSAPGAWVRTTWVHVEPEQTDRLADLYRMVLLPQIVEFEGFASASLLIDRPSGHAVSSVTFDSYRAMRSTSSLAAVGASAAPRGGRRDPRGRPTRARARSPPGPRDSLISASGRATDARHGPWAEEAPPARALALAGATVAMRSTGPALLEMPRSPNAVLGCHQAEHLRPKTVSSAR